MEKQENTAIDELVDAMFKRESLRSEASASSVANSIGALSSASCLVRIFETKQVPGVSIDFGKELPEIGRYLSRNTKSVKAIVNSRQAKVIGNTVKNARNCAERHSTGVFKTTGYNHSFRSPEERLAQVMRVSGYLITRSSLKIFLTEWTEKYYPRYELAVERYIQDYPLHYSKIIIDLKKNLVFSMIESWVNQKRFPSGYITRLIFNSDEAAETRFKEERDHDPSIYGHWHTLDSGSVILHLIQRHDKFGMDLVENIKYVLSQYSTYLDRHIPPPTDLNLIRGRFKLEFVFDRIPNKGEISSARNEQLEAEFATGVRKLTEKMRIKAKTVWEEEQEMKSKFEDDLRDVFQGTLLKALMAARDSLLHNESSEKITKRRDDNISLEDKSLQSLLGKQNGKYKTVGLLANLEDIAGSMVFGSKEMRDYISQVRKALNLGSRESITTGLTKAIEELTDELADLSPDRTEDLNLLEFEELDLPSSVTQKQDRLYELDEDLIEELES